MFEVRWEKKVEEELRKSGFILQVEHMANMNVTEILTTPSPLIFYPLRIRLYERLGWKMCYVDAKDVTRTADYPLFERMLVAIFEKITVNLFHSEGFDMLTFIGNTGNYIPPRGSAIHEFLHIIAMVWCDQTFLHVETYEEFPALCIAPNWSHQAYAIGNGETEWVIYAGRTGRTPSDYRIDGTSLHEHHLKDQELFFEIQRIPKEETFDKVKEWLRRERFEVEHFMHEIVQVFRKYDPSFGFTWGETKTFFEGRPVNPTAQALRIEGDGRRFRILNNESFRILAHGSTPAECLRLLDEHLLSLDRPPRGVSTFGKFAMSLWKQFEEEESLYLRGVELHDVSEEEAKRRLEEAMSVLKPIRRMEAVDGTLRLRYAGLKLSLPTRPPGVLSIQAEASLLSEPSSTEE